MVTIEKKTITQNEQGSTPETNLEVSQKNQKIEEEINDSKKNQEMLTIEQDVKKESKEIQNITIESKTIEQEEKSETKVLEHEAATEKMTLEDEVKTETKALEEEVKTNESIAKTMSEREMAKIIDNATLKIVANEWITKCENLLDGLKGNRESKRELKDKVGRAIDDMKVMIDDEHLYETARNQYKNRLGEIIYYYYDNREPARQTIMMGGRVSVIKGIADTKREVKRDNKRAKDNTEYQIDISELKQNTALYTRIGVSADEWGKYCDFIGQGGISVTHPVFVQHTVGFNNVKAYDPDLYRRITPDGEITYSTYCQRDPERYEQYCKNNNVICRPESFATTAGRGVTEMISQMFPGVSSDPRKKQAWEKAGSVLAIGGAIVMGFKFFKNLFSSKKDNENKWRKAAGRGAGLLALLNIRNFNKRAEDISGIHPAEKTRMLAESFKTYGFSNKEAIDMADRYIGAPVTTITALHFIPIYELEKSHILEDKNGEFEFNYKNYEAYINKFAWDKDQKEQALKAGEKLDKDKSVGTGLKAFGITTWEKLRELFGSDINKTLAQTEEVQKGWENMEKRIVNGVNATLFKNGFRIKDPENVDLIMKEYDDKKEDKKDNELILDWMERGLLEFNEDKPYKLKEIRANPNIDLKKMTMKGFKNGANEVEFSTYKELFEVVYLTDWIKKNYKGRITAKDSRPFHINAVGQLDFNDSEWYEIHKTDTTVLHLKEFKNIPTIGEHKDNKAAYVDYLNDWRLSSLGK